MHSVGEIGAQQSPDYSKEQASLLEKGFNQPYVGGALNRLLEVLDYCHEEYNRQKTSRSSHRHLAV